MAQNEIQTLNLYGGPTGGTCDISFYGETASGVAYNASAASVQSALEALSNIGAGNVSCSGGPWPGSAITCEFVSSLASTALPQMDIDPSDLTGSSITASIAETTKGGYDLDTNLANYWPCSESSGNLLDSEGSTDLTLTGTAGSTPGIQGNARYASSAAFSITGNGGLSDPGTNRTISLWAKFDSAGTASILSSFYGATQYYSVSLSSGIAQLRVLNASGGGSSVSASTFGALSSGTWYHIVAYMNYSTGDVGIAVNGQLDTDNFSLKTFGPSGGTFTLSCSARAIDEVAVWTSRILTAAEITSLYNSGAGRSYPLPSGGGGNEVQTLTLTGSPSAGTLALSDGITAISVDYNSSASALEDLLEGLSTIGAGNVSCSGGSLPGTAITITYQGDLAGVDVDLLSLDYNGLLAVVNTTQEGSPTPSQASAVWSSSTLTPHITGGSSVWSSGDSTASGVPEQSSAAWSGSDLQAPGIVDDTLPTSAWSSGIVSSAVLTGASAAWSSGTAILPGVFSAPAQANWKTVQFAVLPDYPVMAYWKTKSVTSDYNPLNIPTATWSSGTAQPAPALTGYASAAWSTTEATLELTSVPVTATWSTGSDVLSPVLTGASAVWSGKDIITPLFADSAYIGMATFRIIDTSLLVLSFTGESITQPDGFNGAVTSPEGVSGTLTSPEGVSGSIA